MWVDRLRGLVAAAIGALIPAIAISGDHAASRESRFTQARDSVVAAASDVSARVRRSQQYLARQQEELRRDLARQRQELEAELARIRRQRQRQLEASRRVRERLLAAPESKVADSETEARHDYWEALSTRAAMLEEPSVVYATEAEILTRKVVDTALSAGVHAGLSAVSYWACATAGVLLIGPGGELAGGVCMLLMQPSADQLTEHVHRQLFDRRMYPDAKLVGAIVGSIAGTYVAIPLVDTSVAAASRNGLSLWDKYDDYSSYSARVRSLTEDTMRAHGKMIDPRGLRGPAHHLHHRIPIKCGWSWGIPAAVVASAFNLKILPAEENLRLGAGGC